MSFVLTIFSNIFENALTSEIGLYLSQFVVSPDLCIGITLVDLSFSGKMPVDKLRLKICASGRSISYDCPKEFRANAVKISAVFANKIFYSVAYKHGSASF